MTWVGLRRLTVSSDDGIVVVEVGGKECVVVKRMSPALRERLGQETARELEEYVEGLGSDWRDQMMESAAERFDARLAAVSMRVDSRFDAVEKRFEAVDKRFDAIDNRFEAVDRRFAAVDSRLDTLQKEMQQGFTRIWQAMADFRVAIRQELADNRVELLRWSFLFWIGQVIAVASLLAFMLRGVAPR